MPNKLRKLDIDSYYADAIREAKTDKLEIKEGELNFQVITELYDRHKIKYDNLFDELESSKQKLFIRRNEYIQSEKDRLIEKIQKEYRRLDKEVAMATEKAQLNKDNKHKAIEHKLKIIEDFRESEKEMLTIIDQSIKVERDKQKQGESSWGTISAFIDDIKAKTLPTFQKRKEEEIDPLLNDVKEFNKEVRKIEKEILSTTEKINVVYSEKILTLNKNNKQEELRILDLHRRTMSYLEAQLVQARDNLHHLGSLRSDLEFSLDKQNVQSKNKVMQDRKDLLLQFSTNLDSEFDDLEATMKSFNKIGEVQQEMKNLSEYIQKDITDKTSRIGREEMKLIDNVVLPEEESK